jgi:hypothetical protein
MAQMIDYGSMRRVFSVDTRLLLFRLYLSTIFYQQFRLPQTVKQCWQTAGLLAATSHYFC